MYFGGSQIDPTLTIEKMQTADEGQYFERKSARVSDSHLAQTISAFANASGGVIAVGIEDGGDITGVDTARENKLRQLPTDFLRTIPQIKIELIETGNGKKIFLFHVTTEPNEVVKLKSNGDAFVRIGDSSRKLNAEQLVELEYDKGIRSYESQILTDATMEDLDNNLIQEYCQMLNLSASEPSDILKARGLIKKGEKGWEITVAAILLFGKIPTQFLPSARVRFLRYEGTTAGVGQAFNLVKDVTLEKPLHYLIQDGRELLQSQMREFQQLGKDGKFHKIPEYPEFAWLEGLVNAVAHRDYSISGEYIRITMYDDRIEFSSPGKLPYLVTVDNIQTTRFSRNPNIARVLSDFGWVRELNEGVKRIYTDMKSYFLEPPIFKEPENRSVQLILKNNIASRSLRKMESLQSISVDEWAALSPLDRNIIYYIVNEGHCTPKKLEELVGKSRQTILQHIRNLQKERPGLIQEHSTSANDPTKFYTVE